MILTKPTAISANTIAAVAAVAMTVIAFTTRDDADQISATHIEWVRGTPTSTQLEVALRAGTTPGCGDPYRVKVVEHVEKVLLTAKIRFRGFAADGQRPNLCPASGRVVQRLVTLKSPLGDRQVIDTFQQANGEPGIVEIKRP